jgi:hypothetical protein
MGSLVPGYQGTGALDPGPRVFFYFILFFILAGVLFFSQKKNIVFSLFFLFFSLFFSLSLYTHFGADKRDTLAPTSSVPLGSPGGCSSKKTFLKKEKILRKDCGNTSVTGGLRTGDSKKFESIRINLKDLAWSQVFPRDPGISATLDLWDQVWNHPWNPI